MSVIDAVVENHLESNVSQNLIESTAINLQSTDFELFQLPVQAAIDLAVLSKRWRELQTAVHPDRFAASGPSAVRIAMQYSTRINEAYQRLKLPQSRFGYLCELKGELIESESNTSMPVEFLTQQMIWRETLEESTKEVDLQSLQLEVNNLKSQLESDCASAIDEEKDFKSAAQFVRSLMFVNRFQEYIDKKLDLLE